MRILLVAPGYPPDEAAGTELYAAAAAAALAELGHEIWVFAANPSARQGAHRTEQDGAVTVERFLGRAPVTPGDVPPLVDETADTAFSAALERFRPDVVHVVSLLHLSHRLVAIARASHVPTVVSPCDFWFLCPRIHLPVGAQRHPLRGRLWGLNCFTHTEGRSLRWLASLLYRGRLAARIRWHIRRAVELRATLNHADLVLAPSEFVRRRYLEFGVSSRKLEVLPLGLEAVPVERTPRGGGPRIGYLGAFLYDKGPDLLVRAFRRVPADARLVLRGPEPEPGYVASLKAAAAGDPRIEIGPPVDAGRVGEFLAELDLLVVPSRLHESFSRVAREAFVAGVPVLAGAAGALPEIIRPGRNGTLFKAGDEDDLAQRMRELLEPGVLDGLRDFPAVKTMTQHAAELVARYRRIAERDSGPY